MAHLQNSENKGMGGGASNGNLNALTPWARANLSRAVSLLRELYQLIAGNISN